MAAVREAHVTWSGNLSEGNGTINEVTSSSVNGPARHLGVPYGGA